MTANIKTVTEETEKENERNTFSFKSKRNYTVEYSKCGVCLDMGKREKTREETSSTSYFLFFSRVETICSVQD